MISFRIVCAFSRLFFSQSPFQMGGECKLCGSASSQVCSRCKSAAYCSKACQREHWAVHKKLCAPSAEIIQVSTPNSKEELQAAIDAAPEGATLILPAGQIRFGIALSKAINLKGAGTRHTELLAPLVIRGGTKVKPVLVDNLVCKQGVVVEKDAYTTLEGLHIANLSNGSGIQNNGRLLVRKCRIEQCADGILNQSGDLTVDSCLITNCDEDGIFSNPTVTVQNCTIQNVGRHGIKSRGGTNRLGSNNIQASPWDSFGGYGIPGFGSSGQGFSF